VKKLSQELFYIDSNVFIYPLIYDSASVVKAHSSKNLLLKVAMGEVRGYTSVLTWDEVTYVARKLLGLEESLKIGRMLLAFPNLKLLPIKVSTIIKAQELMENFGIKPRDSIHASIALENNTRTIASFDNEFDKVPKLKRIEP